jgi:hypothetical protein
MASSCGSGPGGVVCHIIPFVPIVGGEVEDGGKAAQNAVSAAGSDVLTGLSNAMASAADGLLKTLSSFWMNIGTPDLTSTGSPAAAIQADVGWVTTCTAVVCILVAAGRIAVRRRGQPAAVMAMGLTRLVVVSAAATFLVQAAGKLGDTFSADLMNTAHLGSGGWSSIISTTALASAFAGGDGMLLIIALLIIFSSLIQLMLMILRVGLLVILTGTLPLAAAASMSDWGETWWRKHIAWLTAWLLYKPAAALLYAAAFALTDGKRTAVEVISGFMLLILSILILPALLKVIMPMTAALGAASSGTLAMGAAGAAATGAIKIAAMAGTGGAAGAASASGAAAAPTGNAVAAVGTKTSSPAGAGPSTQADPPSRPASSSSERAVAHPQGTQSPAKDGARNPAPQSAATADHATGSPSADGARQESAMRPSGALPPELTDITGPSGPPGAVDRDDDDKHETGG